MNIFPLVHMAVSMRASDLHLVAFNPPLLRIDGTLAPIEGMPPLAPDEIEQAFSQIVSAEEKAEFERSLELDFGYSIPGVVRLRGNAARQRGSLSLVLRLLPLTIPTLDQLELPSVCKDLIRKPRGLVVVGGPTGSGKSTTLAAMINFLNRVDSRRVVTIEDPIEYMYGNIKSTITQRELGSDTHSFPKALKHVLRQDPDVILVGEMRDLETAAAVLTLAETGHLVLTTGHAPSASQAIERIVDLFPLDERNLAQSRLASLLVAVLCQTLVPRAKGSGRAAAVEVMLANPAVKNLIREGKIYQLPNAIRMHAQQGMMLLDQALAKLYDDGTISSDSLFAFCNDREEVERLSLKIQATLTGART